MRCYLKRKHDKADKIDLISKIIFNFFENFLRIIVTSKLSSFTEIRYRVVSNSIWLEATLVLFSLTFCRDRVVHLMTS